MHNYGLRAEHMMTKVYSKRSVPVLTHQFIGICANANSQTSYVNGLYPTDGTELSAAMRAFLGSRRTSMPTVAFILTDGGVNKVSCWTVNLRISI